jgi:competence protein ComEA
VYRLDLGSRIDKALQTAGGLTGEADRGWVEKNVNKAQMVVDGYKLYIPKKNQDGLNLQVAGLQSRATSINSGSQNDLESLPGIGPVTAQKIISGRPYTRLEELTERKIVGQKVWESIKDQISLW